MEANFLTWLIEFQVASFVVLLIAIVFLWKLRPGAGRIAVGWVTGGALLVLGGWLAIPDRPVLSRLDVIPGDAPIAAAGNPQLTEEMGQEVILSDSGPMTDLALSEHPSSSSDAPLLPPVVMHEVSSKPAFDWWTFGSTALVWAWGLGFAAVTVWNVIGRFALWRVKRSRTAASKDLQSLFDELRADQVRATLHCSDGIQHAIAVGVFRPSVVIPRSFGEVSAFELKSVLAHELAHLRNRDLWLLAVFRLLGPLVSIQPFYWLVRWRIRESQELLADQAAAAGQPVEYAGLLVQWARDRAQTARPTPMPVAGMLPLSQTGKRVMALVDEGGRPMLSCSRSVMASLVAALVLAMTATAGLTIRPASEQSVSIESTQQPRAHANAIVGQASDQPVEELVVALTGQPAVSGRCLDSEGNPLAEVDIAVDTRLVGNWGQIEKGDTLQKTKTNSLGEFQLMNLFEGPPTAEDEHVAIAVLPRRNLAVQFQVRRQHTEKNLEVVLVPMESVSGRIASKSGAPVAGATVKLLVQSQGHSLRGAVLNPLSTSDKNGEFQFDQLISGVTYFVQASKEGFKKTGSLAVVKRNKQQLTVEVEPLEPIVTVVVPRLPMTRGMTPESAFKLLAAGMPGKHDRESSKSYEQYLVDAETWGRALRELAKRSPKTEVAFKACTRILDTPHPRSREAHAVRAIQRQAGQILLKDFIERKDLVPYVERLITDDRANATVTAQQLVDKSPHPDVIGVAMWLLSRFQRTNNLELLKTVHDKYGDVSYRGTTLGALAETAIRVKTFYSEGGIPGDIVGPTLDGKTMKLSDHRGKVVLIWFWGTWSTGDKRVGEMMQRLNRISDNLKDQPFQVLGVAMDTEGKAKEVVRKYQTAWPSWFEGKKGRGQINREWGLGGNRLVLIGREGKIIDPDLTEYDLSRAITAAVAGRGANSSGNVFKGSDNFEWDAR